MAGDSPRGHQKLQGEQHQQEGRADGAGWKGPHAATRHSERQRQAVMTTRASIHVTSISYSAATPLPPQGDIPAGQSAGQLSSVPGTVFREADRSSGRSRGPDHLVKSPGFSTAWCNDWAPRRFTALPSPSVGPGQLIQYLAQPRVSLLHGSRPVDGGPGCEGRRTARGRVSEQPQVLLPGPASTEQTRRQILDVGQVVDQRRDVAGQALDLVRRQQQVSGQVARGADAADRERAQPRAGRGSVASRWRSGPVPPARSRPCSR